MLYRQINARAGCRMNEISNTARGVRSRVQYEEFRVHSTASKCVYLPVKHELEVSNPFIIQTEYTAVVKCSKYNFNHGK